MISAAMSPVTSSASALSKVIAPEAFTEYKNLVLGTPGLAIGSHVTTDNATTIWIHNQVFASWPDAWRWVCQMQNVETRRACCIDLVSQKIRSLNAAVKTAEEISGFIKKDYVNLGLEKKEATALRESLGGYIKAIRYCRFALLTRTVPILN